MEEKHRHLLTYAWAIVLAVAAIGFAWRGVLPTSSDTYVGMSGGEQGIFRALNWLGFVVALGFAGLPWVRRQG